MDTVHVDVTTEALVALVQVRVDGESPADVLRHVAVLARTAADADAAAIRLLLAGRVATGACTDGLASRVDDLQHHLGQGPTPLALEQGRPVVVASLGEDRRWPGLHQAATADGVQSVLAVPLHAHERPVGALTVYASRPGCFDEAAAARVGAFARHAAVVLANAQVYWEVRQLTDNLHQALDSRATIDHAIGILLAGGSPSPAEAFQLLVRASQRENRKLRDIAADIVAHATERNRRRSGT